MRTPPMNILLSLSLVAAVSVASAKAAPVDENADARRVALVVGVGDYDRAPDLPNPINDARAVAAELWRSGFEVIEILDPNIELLKASVQVMGERLEPGAHVAFFFAGHGVQIANRNYLLARDVDLLSGEERAKEFAVSANDIAVSLANSGAALSIVVLDACRNNPFEALAASSEQDVNRGLRLSGNSRAGLAEIDIAAANEFLLAFSTSPGAVALDGQEGENSPFTSALISTLKMPHVEVHEVFNTVKEMVSSRTDGLQVPWIYSELQSGFIFREDVFSASRGTDDAVDTLGALPPTLVLEQTLWTNALRSGQQEQVELYLREHPEGIYANAAQQWLDGNRSNIAQINAPSSVDAAEDPAILVASGVRTRFESLLSKQEFDGLDSVRFEAFGDDIRFLDAFGENLSIASIPINAARDVIIETGSANAGRGGRIFLRSIDGTERSVDIVVEYGLCDMVAGYPHDPNRVGRGARLELMRPRLAVEACRIAVERYPNSVRLKAILGRAYRALGDYEAARHWNAFAVEAGYSTAIVDLGKMSLLGLGGPVDKSTAAELFRRAHELGDGWGTNALGQAYLFGDGVPKDPEHGIALIRQSAQNGNDWANTLMGRVYDNGWGVARSPETAVQWYKNAASMGDPSAKLELSDAYRHGDGVAPDPAEALRWIESAAGQGWTFAQARLGREYELGELVPRDMNAALSWYEAAAAKGDREGEFRLGRALLLGEGREADPSHAIALLRLSASKNNVEALYLLGDVHENGELVPKDLPFAQEMFQKSWDHGYPPAARRLAVALMRGYDGTVNGKAAVQTLEAMIELTDDQWAIRDLAAILRDGNVVEQDPERSAQLTLRAVAKENPYAFRDHARNLAEGFGIDKDENAAFEFMQLAAATENPWARLDFARYHAQGVGTKRNNVEAAVWLARTSALGDPRSAELALERATRLGPDVLLDAMVSQLAVDGGANIEDALVVLRDRGVDRDDAAAVFELLTEIVGPGSKSR